MISLLAAASTAAAMPAKNEAKRVADAATVIRELRSAPDNGIPESTWERARCVAVMPGAKKAAFVFGGEFGKGVVSCRTTHGWSAPLGADASIAAGPVGRTGTAATDAQLTAEMLSYSRARGLFAGIDLSGGVLRPDNDASRDFYGHAIADREILLGKAAERIPAAANPFIAALNGAHRSTAKHSV